MIKELQAIYDSRASFYKKAFISDNQNTIYLYSYDIQILKLYKKNNTIEFLTKNINHYTMTTCRHINEFIKQFTNGHGMSKKEILKKAGIKQ